MSFVFHSMKGLACLISLCILLSGCGGRDIPDVSAIEVPLEVQRFEKDFFSIDTSNIAGEFNRLRRKYPLFISDFNYNILGLPPVSDTSEQIQEAIRKFIADYRPIKDSADKNFSNLEESVSEVRKGLQFVKHYFPKYPIPSKLITFIGPMDAYFEASLGGYGDAITADALIVGLQLHMGSNFSVYTSEMGQALYPSYVSRKFTEEYIPVNCIKNIVDDLFPDNSSSLALVEQMVEKGKRIYVLDQLMPRTADTLKLGYTAAQLKGCYDNEGLIFNFFLTNSLLYKNEPGIVKNYIGESPSTQELGEGAPGNIGLFVGWQIVKKYMSQNENLKLEQLMATNPKKIFEESKYRPR